MKKILVDLSVLSNLTCGFGQISLNYGKLFSQVKLDNAKFVFLVPKEFIGSFGDEVEYVEYKKIYKYFPFLLPKVDIWHSTNQQFRLVRIASETKRLLTIHDLNFLKEKKPSSIKRRLRKIQRMVDKSDIITVISQYVAEDLKKHIDMKEKELIIVHNGVERIDNKPSTQPDFAEPNHPFFFTIGQIRKKKNFHVLIDVMKSFPEHNLYICGDDHFDYADAIREKINKEQIKNVFLTSTIKESEKIWLYKNCEAFLFPSTLEGFGLPVIEAMQFGKAIFSSNCTSLPEVCGNSAFIWENFDTDYMVKVIKNNLPGFYEKKEQIEKVKKHAFSYSYEKHINAYLNIYKKLMK